jgi:hypothetical protein
MVSHDHLEYVGLWQHKPGGRHDKESMRDALTVRLNEFSEIIFV